MRKPATTPSALTATTVLLSVLFSGFCGTAIAAENKLTPAEQGKKIAFDKKKGNCLACHAIDDGVSPGDMGPPLIAMKQRFPDRARLEAQLNDPIRFNPDSAMPPFGKHRILAEDELNKVIEYLYTL
jgi:sulfur-oxidizing protein SoxX